MRRSIVRTTAIGAFAVLLLAACGSSGSSKAAKNSNSSSNATTAPAAGYGASDATVTTAGGSNATGTATVAVADNAKIGKKILVDAKGMTLYVWDNDTTAGKASCTGKCAAAWPPLDVTAAASYGTGLNASMFSTVAGPNGEKQLAVNGKPLYTWVNDKAPGEATGQGVNHFYVVGVDGKKIDTD